MFIYVMDADSKCILENLGYTLLKKNDLENGTVWVFVNNGDWKFENLEVPCVVSDVLTF